MNNTIRTLWKTCSPFLILAATIYCIHLAGLDKIIDEDWIDSYIRGQGFWGYCIFLGLASVLASLPFPRQIISFLGGYAFGAGMGTLCAMIATIAGCVLTFTWARRFAQAYVLRRYGQRVQKINDFLAQNPFSMALMIRCMPTGSNFLVNIAAGVSHIPAKSFFAGSSLGYLPQTLIFALLGSGVNVDPTLRTSLSVVLFMTSTLLFAALCRRYKRGR